MFVGSSSFYMYKAKQLREQGDLAGAQRYESQAFDAKQQERQAKPNAADNSLNKQTSSKHIVFKTKLDAADKATTKVTQSAFSSQNPFSNTQRQAAIARDSDGRPVGIRSLHGAPKTKRLAA